MNTRNSNFEDVFSDFTNILTNMEYNNDIKYLFTNFSQTIHVDDDVNHIMDDLMIPFDFELYEQHASNDVNNINNTKEKNNSRRMNSPGIVHPCAYKDCSKNGFLKIMGLCKKHYNVIKNRRPLCQEGNCVNYSLKGLKKCYIHRDNKCIVSRCKKIKSYGEYCSTCILTHK